MLLLLLFHSCNSRINSVDSVVTTEDDSTLDFTPAADNENYISIPGMDGLNFKSNTLNQTVDFYNPESNKCYFIIELYLSDGVLIWRSSPLKPSEHIRDIQLLKSLNKGIYRHCKLLYNCYSLSDNKPLNNGEVILEINVK